MMLCRVRMQSMRKQWFMWWNLEVCPWAACGRLLKLRAVFVCVHVCACLTLTPWLCWQPLALRRSPYARRLLGSVAASGPTGSVSCENQVGATYIQLSCGKQFTSVCHRASRESSRAVINADWVWCSPNLNHKVIGISLLVSWMGSPWHRTSVWRHC